MELSNAQRAQVLTQALPYIQRYSGKIIVIKYGGSAMTDETLQKLVMQDIVLLWQVGIKAVLVHGGGPEINGLLKKVGKESLWKNGLRVTDSETMEYVQMALAGKVNKSLVNLIQHCGGQAMGLCGVDGGMMLAHPADPELGYVGEVDSVDPAPIIDLLNRGYIPVISTIACSPDGCIYNINADTAAAEVAAALKAECLISMTDVAGILRDKDDLTTLIPQMDFGSAQGLRQEGVISGGMIPKVNCCFDAIRGGVKRVFILDGRIPHAILIEILTDEGIGTMFVEKL